ncbi:hypothetical protein AWZ03_003571 [Drosophila navojoa]|uniref:Dynamin-type G domain-containing protein n=1 Tax=Drosophila navojoa TaxID=7232 RepID=A0A484BQP7_DRONA|nr:transmembrane GTPase fzo [Drosophila navojoa]TDG50061.1 hypothetical protein AWZ03_003571 [Drosophila navojoa]
MSTMLSEFGQAKMDMLNIYEDMARHLQLVVDELQLMPSLKDLMNERMRSELLACIQRIKAICPMLQRKRMKVAFFGRTSNGKSAVINAMLHERILPSAMGHTTSCFCQVEACARQESAHVTIEDGDDQKLSIDCLRELASAHSGRALSPHSLLHVRWPSSSCQLLGHDVVLLDTPGVDVTAQLDECIDRHCLNADVFVLVLNAESTISRVERQFFELVAQQLSRPNLFILNNRWDAAASLEPQLEQLVRAQHTQRCLQLLVEELGIYANVELARRRIFHVSALETLRLRQHAKTKEEDRFRAPGAQLRYEEFLSFERKFAECITQSALRTKFEQHCVGAAEMLLQLHELLQQLAMQLAQLGEEKTSAKAALTAGYEGWEQQSVQRQEELSQQVEQLSEESCRLAAQLLHEQILRLPAAVQQFHVPFQPHLQRELRHYQRLLGVHLEQLLLQQVELQLGQLLQLQMRQLGSAPADCVLPVQLYCALDCQQLMSGFQADLEFRFSWGMVAILKRIQAKMPLPLPQLPQLPKQLNGQREELMKLPSHVGVWLPDTENSTGTILLLCGVLTRTLGWRLTLALGVVTGAFYAYERFSWTPQAQERSFKSQYTQHLQRRLRDGLQQTAAGFGQQVRQQLTRSMQQLQRETEHKRNELSEDLAMLGDELAQLQQHQSKLQALQATGEELRQRLKAFQQRYLPEKDV